MPRKLAIAVLLTGLSCLPLGSHAQKPTDNRMAKAVSVLQTKLGPDWVFKWNPEHTGLVSLTRNWDFYLEHGRRAAPLLMADTDANATPEAVAREALSRYGTLFQLPADIGDLELGRVVGSDAGGSSMVDFYQTLDGLPVVSSNGMLRRQVVVATGSKKDIESISSSYMPHINIQTTPRLTADAALAIGRRDLLENRMQLPAKEGFKEPIPSKQWRQLPITHEQPQLIVYITAQEQPVLAYALNIQAGSIVHARYVIDANDGDILLAGDPSMYYTNALGKVFWPNPVNTLNDRDKSLADNGDADTIPGTAYFPTVLHDVIQITGGYVLRGPYVTPNDVLEPPIYFNTFDSVSFYGSVFNSNPFFSFDNGRADKRFEHVMVYSTIDSNQRYIQSLGLAPDINKRAIQVDPHGFEGQDLSRYAPDGTGKGYLTFGEGGVDDAEDTDVILHEYGHAIQDNQAPGKYVDLSCSTEAGAMAEGFGDYWQASNTRAVSIGNGFDPACYAEWDWRGDAKNKGTLCKRKVNSKKTYSDFKGIDCHDDGQIWSSALWAILTALGSTENQRKVADQLILQSHFEVQKMEKMAHPTFVDGGVALLNADVYLNSKGLFQKSHKGIICKALKTQRGILVPGCK